MNERNWTILAIIALGALALLVAQPQRAIAAAEPPSENQAADDDRDAPPPMAGPRRPRPRPGDGPPDGFRGPMEDGPDGMRPDGSRMPPPEEVDAAMAWIKERFPQLHQRLENMRQNRPGQFMMAMRRLTMVRREYNILKDRNPALSETIINEIKNEEQLHSLVKEYRDPATTDARKAELDKEIEGLVRTQIESMQQRQAARIADFEERIRRQQEKISKEKEQLEAQKSRIDEMVSRRMEDLKAGRFRDRLLEGGPGRTGHDDGRGPDGEPGPPRRRWMPPKDRPIAPPDQPPPDDHEPGEPMPPPDPDE